MRTESCYFALIQVNASVLPGGILGKISTRFSLKLAKDEQIVEGRCPCHKWRGTEYGVTGSIPHKRWPTTSSESAQFSPYSQTGRGRTVLERHERIWRCHRQCRL